MTNKDPKKEAKLWQRGVSGSKARFRAVYTESYAGGGHLIDAAGGFALALIFVLLYQTDSQVELRVAWFFGIGAAGYLIFLALTYGIVRARNAGTKKPDN